MSANADSVQKLQHELQNVLNKTNELLMSISDEIQKLKHFTSADGEFEATIKQNASVMATLASLQKLDITNLPPVARNN